MQFCVFFCTKSSPRSIFFPGEKIRPTSSSPDSLNADRSDKSNAISPSPGSLYKLVVPLLRCEVVDVRDSAVNALGMINHDAFKWVLFICYLLFAFVCVIFAFHKVDIRMKACNLRVCVCVMQLHIVVHHGYTTMVSFFILLLNTQSFSCSQFAEI